MENIKKYFLTMKHNSQSNFNQLQIAVNKIAEKIHLE